MTDTTAPILGSSVLLGPDGLAPGIKPYYQDAAVTIYHGDNRIIMPQLAPFDLLLTDPPYGIDIAKTGKVGGNNKGVARDYGSSDWDKEVVDEWVMFLARRLGRKQIIWGGNYYDLPPCKGPLVWDKENTGNFADGEIAWNNLGCGVRIKRHLWNGMIRKGGEDRDHPTQKPLEVISWALQLAGGVTTVLDPWAGSGTTGRACKDLGKLCVLIEREERYCEVAAKRMEQEVLPLGA